MDLALLDLLQNVFVVLVRPRVPENIGAAARAVANMGLGGLRLVDPADLTDKPMRALATAQGQRVLESMTVSDSLAAALADCVAAAATTARLGERRGALIPPRQAAPEIMTWARRGPVAVVFGPEDRGLSHEQVDLCRLSINIPTSQASSLNLAQSVIVLAYELRLAAENGAGLERRKLPTPAPLGEIQALLAHLQEAFVNIGHLDANNPAHFMRLLKAPLERAAMTSKEVRAWRGVARQVNWLHGRLARKD
ncbi:tRNA/rRNA methyltransferase (SpoU) [Desulfarculus baarsii DSM 2075]|uniref:tRNA/rRNA methyltransferase (SpoU) n=1 Tax=Desulfarculus baarsii (strain ATCC 33931 / DSM 2075 / LMG 7858 / VKM B-1802 / 2st14) TaxID=644282 RepID=E1QDP1_DESB2|nr:TrmH family RNA methyltransferase [Desulfarculus baarsii]ADK83677.1 tRNA/rRNA methyltransferase (SpoU) [Desulfarculus baarsii DSM 2075]